MYIGKGAKCNLTFNIGAWYFYLTSTYKYASNVILQKHVSHAKKKKQWKAESRRMVWFILFDNCIPFKDKIDSQKYTWVKIALALERRRRVAISLAAKLSAMDTTTQPANIIPRYITTALTVIGMSMAIASPCENVASTAFATTLWFIFQNLCLNIH